MGEDGRGVICDTWRAWRLLNRLDLQIECLLEIDHDPSFSFWQLIGTKHTKLGQHVRHVCHPTIRAYITAPAALAPVVSKHSSAPQDNASAV